MGFWGCEQFDESGYFDEIEFCDDAGGDEVTVLADGSLITDALIEVIGCGHGRDDDLCLSGEHVMWVTELVKELGKSAG